MKKIIFTLLAMSLVAFFSVTQAQNLVVNGDLEAWTSDTEPTGWTKAESISKESTVLHGGSFAAKHTSGDGTLDFSQDVEALKPEQPTLFRIIIMITAIWPVAVSGLIGWMPTALI